MSVEEEKKTASRQLIGLLIGLAVFEFILVGLGLVISVYVTEANIHIPSDLFFFAIAVFVCAGISPIIFFVERARRLETLFWKEIAAHYGYTYVHRPYFQNSALMFQEGINRATRHGLVGTLHDRPFRFFQYRYTTREGKSGRIRTYCVAEVAFSGTFPHIYLNNTHNYDLSNLKGFFLPRISLPAALEGKFNLHAPQEYEIEALEIFTPDLLLHLLETDWEHDIELVDQKLYVFREKPIRSKQDLEHEIARLQKLVELLAPKLNRMKLTPIGDHKTTL